MDAANVPEHTSLLPDIEPQTSLTFSPAGGAPNGSDATDVTVIAVPSLTREGEAETEVKVGLFFAATDAVFSADVKPRESFNLQKIMWDVSSAHGDAKEHDGFDAT